MNITKLIDLLLKQKENLKMLLANSKKKQQALVKRNRQILEECIQEEQELIFSVQAVEAGRLEIIKEINKQHGLDENEVRLTKLRENLSEVLTEEAQEAIIKSEKEIRSFVLDITKTNKHNQFLIKHAQQFNNTMLKAVFGVRNKSLVDRKI